MTKEKSPTSNPTKVVFTSTSKGSLYEQPEDLPRGLVIVSNKPPAGEVGESKDELRKTKPGKSE